MAEKRPGKKSLQKPAEPSKISDEDLTVLDAFCEKIQIQETSFEAWQRCHADLDLQLPVFVSSDEAHAGCDKEVRVSRSIRTGRSAPQREKTVIVVTVPPGTRDGQEILCKGEGDRRDEHCGDVRIKVRIKH